MDHAKISYFNPTKSTIIVFKDNVTEAQEIIKDQMSKFEISDNFQCFGCGHY